MSEQDLELDRENQFGEDVVIKFTHMANGVPGIYSTVIIAYKGKRLNKIYLESEELIFLK